MTNKVKLTIMQAAKTYLNESKILLFTWEQYFVGDELYEILKICQKSPYYQLFCDENVLLCIMNFFSSMGNVGKYK